MNQQVTRKVFEPSDEEPLINKIKKKNVLSRYKRAPDDSL